MRKSLPVLIAAVVGVASFLTGTSPVYAQVALVESSPAPEAVLPAPPETITLTFDHPLSDQGSSIRVTDEAGEQVDDGDAQVSADDRHILSVSLPLVVEGTYTVTYTAAGLGYSTVTMGSYPFTVDLPPSRLMLEVPVDGQAFESGPVPLEMSVEFFDFGLYGNRIRVYVDGELHTELRTLTYQLDQLTPGVHEITVVLAQFEDQELPDTAITVHVAIAQPGSSEGSQGADDELTPPEISPVMAGAAIVLALVLLALGVWLASALEE
jgi:methionine-rich copper-binding protein CopC